LRQFGSGNPGLIDGNREDASFSSPRGLALWKDALYVADSGNHAIRRVPLLGHGDVETVAGNGSPGLAPERSAGESDDALRGPLNAPWDLVAAQDHLYIAMAGAQQVWDLDLTARTLQPLAGSGRLGLVDGAGPRAAFGQPA